MNASHFVFTFSLRVFGLLVFALRSVRMKPYDENITVIWHAEMSANTIDLHLLFGLRVCGVSSVTARLFGIVFVSRLLSGRLVLSLNTDTNQGFDYTPCDNHIDSHPILKQYFMHWCNL